MNDLISLRNVILAGKKKTAVKKQRAAFSQRNSNLRNELHSRDQYLK